MHGRINLIRGVVLTEGKTHRYVFVGTVQSLHDVRAHVCTATAGRTSRSTNIIDIQVHEQEFALVRFGEANA